MYAGACGGCANHLARVYHWLPRAAQIGHGGVFTDKGTLAHPDGGDACQHPKMTSDPAAAWVQVALPIHEQEIGRWVKLSQCIKDGGHFAERQQAGHVGHAGGAAGDGVAMQGQVSEGEHGNGRTGDAPILLKADIYPRDGADRGQIVVGDDQAAQLLLDRNRFGGSHVPCVGRRYPQLTGHLRLAPLA